jgi:hypothetical protein
MKALLEEAHPRVDAGLKTKYPQLVDAKQFGAGDRLKARIDDASVGHGLFLGYCTLHEKYYLDHKHTNGEIRCPICDTQWLAKHGITD